MDLPAGQDEIIKKLASVNPKTIVALIGGSVMNVEKWVDEVGALFHLWYPGEAGGTIFSKLLFGELNPAGRLPFSWAKDLNDYPCHANGNYPGNRTDPDPRVRYDEGIFIGYRHFDRQKTMLRYPFGFGLSYSTFDMEILDVKQTGMTTFDASCEVTVKVKNTSAVRGSEVAQIYVGAVAPEFERPVKELRAFAKFELDPGEEKIHTFSLTWREFACFHPDHHHWCVPGGDYCISLCRNAAEVIDSKIIHINQKEVKL
jgi:beta-glucosidase